MSDWNIRARELLTGNFALVVACALVLAAVGGWVTYTAYVEPGTHVEERAGPSWETTAEFGHAATVTESNPVYPVGTSLKNRSTYFGAIAPTLDVNFTYGYTANEGGSLAVATDTDLVLRSVKRNRTGAVETRYWQKTRDVSESRTSELAPGESVRVPFSFNASALANESERIDEQLGASVGETEAFVRVTVTLSGTVNGNPVERTERYALPVGVGSTFTVDDPGAVTERHASTRTVAVPNRYGPVRRLGGPFLLAVGLCGAVTLAWTRRSGRLSPPTETEREVLAFREARSDFDGWIHRIDLPPSAFELPRAEAASLSDLVDFAIDTNGSVVEDPDEKTYYVVHDGYLYTYSPPTPGTTATYSETDAEPISQEEGAGDALDGEVVESPGAPGAEAGMGASAIDE